MISPLYNTALQQTSMCPDPAKKGHTLYDDGELRLELDPLETVLINACQKSDERCTAHSLLSLVHCHYVSHNTPIRDSEVVVAFQSLVYRGLVNEIVTPRNTWDSPVLITGSARSGTSVLTRTLSMSEEVCIFNEYSLYTNYERSLDIWNRINSMRQDNPPPLKVCADVATLKSALLRELPLPASNTATRDWLFEQAGRRRKPENAEICVYGDKMPFAYLGNMRKLAEQYPRIKFLLTLRDGRAVIASQLNHYQHAIASGKQPEHWMNQSIQSAEYLWLRSARAWLQHRNSPPASCLEVRFEDVVAEPRRSAQRICEFLGIGNAEAVAQTFEQEYRPIDTQAWRQQYPDMESQLSGEFKLALRELGYD
ncbi:MAG: sulfotransferase [Arenicella sp.]|nr:sulfotransferase [Arenicella sp.]